MEQEEKEVAEPEAPILTFDEILEDKNYQSEFDKRVSKAIETAVGNAKTKWEEDKKAEKIEAEKLAEMNEIQKKDYEIERLNKELAKRDEKQEADNLEKEALKQATEKGIDLGLMGTIDYSKETAETVAEKMKIFTTVSKKIYEQAISDYSKEPTPQTGDRKTSMKTLSDCKTYEDFEEYYKTHKE